MFHSNSRYKRRYFQKSKKMFRIVATNRTVFSSIAIRPRMAFKCLRIDRRRQHTNRQLINAVYYQVILFVDWWIGKSTITRFLERILMKHIESICSLESKLFFDSICSIRIRSRSQDKIDFPTSI